MTNGKEFDAVRTRDELVGNIRDAVASAGFTKVAVGISGGKDSTVTAALCVRALGRDNVIGVLMPDGHQPDIADSEEVVTSLGIPHMTVNIKDAHDALLSAMPVSSARDDGLDFANHAEADINVAPRLRMTALRYVCQANGALLAGTGNASEIAVGYFTKDGDSSCDIAVLSRLTSVEVVEVGRTMAEIPSHLVSKAPADGLSGKTDEERLGVSYADIHAWIRRGTCGNPATDERIAQLNRATGHKRRPAPQM